MGKKLDKITPILTAEEKLVICELISTYSFMWDEKNAIGLSHLFAEECVWGWYRLEGTKVLEILNRKAFTNFVEQTFNDQLKGIQTRHFQTNTIFVESK